MEHPLKQKQFVMRQLCFYQSKLNIEFMFIHTTPRHDKMRPVFQTDINIFRECRSQTFLWAPVMAEHLAISASQLAKIYFNISYFFNLISNCVNVCTLNRFCYICFKVFWNDKLAGELKEDQAALQVAVEYWVITELIICFLSEVAR